MMSDAPPFDPVAYARGRHVLVRAQGVQKTYTRGADVTHALRGIDLEIFRGEYLCVMGPSGSGKSTCMNIVGCLDVPTSGTYRFAGIDVNTLSSEQLSVLRRHFIGFVFQGFQLLARSTAQENVELPLIYQGVPARERRVRALESLAAVGLLGRENHQPSELSGGQQQRVAIARALVTRPLVVLADEPTGNLDSARKHDVMTLLRRLNQTLGVTIVMVTHEPDLAPYTDRIISFRDGRVEGQP
jgi:putative ABC transport system ATP-binding protein